MSSLSPEKQARAAELKAKLAAKARHQASSGLDPDYIILGGELVALYIEAGTKRLGQMLRDFAETTGLTLREAQAPMRAAYNHLRDDMDLKGEDVSQMDDAAAVMAEVRAALADSATSPSAPEGDSARRDNTKGGSSDDHSTDGRDAAAGTKDDAGASAQRAEGVGRSHQGGGEADRRDDGPRRRDRGTGTKRRADAERDDLSRGTGGTDGTPGRSGPRNHVIPEGGLALPGGDKTRARNAVRAIETLRGLEREGRPATSEERQALSLYGGAGTLAAALPNSEGKIRFPDIAADLDRLLTPEERATVEKTSQYAFYTAEPVLRNMWNLAQQLGITGGKVFEPGMGVGGFAGTMPKGFFGEYTGVELDHITAKIAAALYPGHHIRHGDFIRTPMPQDYYDLVIGNPPFARTQIKADPAYPQGFMIHDYFFAKSLDSVRPGGLLMFVTSAGTMNKLDSKARDYMADRADLVGAIRLPNTAFAENGTQVTTDIIVLRKRHKGEAEADPAWRESTPVAVPDKEGGSVELAVNRYFQNHPEMILGEQGAFDTLVGRPRIGVRPRDGADLASDLAAAVARFPRRITSMGDPAQMMTGPRDARSGETKAGSYYMKDGELWQFDGTEGNPVPRRAQGQSGLTKAEYELIADLIPMRNALREVYAADLKGEDATRARKRLNKEYDDFVARRGPINKVETTLRRPSAVQMEGIRQQMAEDARAAGIAFDTGSFDAGPMIAEGWTLARIARARREAAQKPGYREGDFDQNAVPDLEINRFPNIDAFSDDPENFRLRAIEKYDARTGAATKTRVFHENAINIGVQPKITSPEDALLHLLAETGRVDPDRIAELSKSTPQKVREELAGKIFENPETGEFETRAKYLSGNVRAKLREAEAAMRRDERFKANADALGAVLPDPIPRSDIVVPLGAHWFEQTLYSAFAGAKGLRLTAGFKPALGIWVVDGDTGSSEARNAWGTEDMPFADLMGRVMNNKPLRVSRTVKEPDGSTRTFIDEEATQAATDKAAEIRAAFQEWLWSDEARADQLEERYNDIFNAEVAPNHDGGYLTTPGVHSDWSWRPHQMAVIARILQSGSTYMAHTVGAGKTSAMIGAGMEARRLGLARKPWYVVPNHMLVQFATEFQQQYPLADILVADEKRFHTDRRRQFVADAATGNFDAVIITHSAFEKIPASEAAKARVVQGMLDDIREMVASSNASGERGKDMGQQQATLGALNSIAAQLGIKVEKEKGVSTAKKIAQLLEQAEQRLSKLTSETRKDSVFDFDEIGVDMLFVDEAHLFRKLSFATTNGNIKGIDPAGSQASMDLFIKSRIVDERNPGRGLVLASGTPITNTMAELYTLSRIMQPQALAERNIQAFDAWAATFGEVASELEQTPDGGYKEVSRFSKFVNTPELSLMVRQVMDVVTSADLERYVTRPKLKGGSRSLVVVDATPEQQAFQQRLAARMQAIARRKGPVKKGDDILLSVINDGRLAAIDMRLVDPSSDGRGSKLERMIDNIHQRWKDGDNAPLHGVAPGGGYAATPEMRGPSTQIVFSTLGIEASKHNPDFSVHRYIKAELMRRGVPADQIVLAKDLKSHAQKQRAFNDMNEGKTRILIGSRSIFTGVNAQKRVAAIHNLDPLWYPADDEQRNGRGIRQGNMNPEIEILDYSTKGTYDAAMWQMMARKAAFIEAFYRGDPTQRDMEDLGEASQFEQAKAMTTRDPRVLELTDMKAARDKLRRRAGAIETQRARLRGEIRRNRREIAFHDEKIAHIEPVAASLPDLGGNKFAITVGRDAFDSRADAGKALLRMVGDLAEAGEHFEDRRIGSIGGFAIEATYRIADRSIGFSVRFDDEMTADAGWSDDPVGLVRRLEYALAAPERRLGFHRDERARLEKEAGAARKSLDEVKDFAQADELAGLTAQIAGIEAALLTEAEQEAAKESRFGDEPVVAALTGAELGEWSDIVDLQRKAQGWYREHLQGKTVINRETGWEIRFTRDGGGKLRGKPLDYLLRAVPGLQGIITHATLTGTEPDRRGREHVKAVHTLRSVIEIGGRAEPVYIVVREMDDGRKFYDLNLGRFVGTRTDGSRDARKDRVEPDAKVSADSLNIRLVAPEINSDPTLTPARARAINAAARAELERIGIAGRVGAEAGGAGAAAGSYLRGVIRIIHDRGRGWRHTLDHEIIHALRDGGLWGKDYGLFTRDEWRALVRAARGDDAIRARVEAAYPDLPTAGQTEEMVAELYADWAQNLRDDPPGLLRQALARIRSFFRALASALRGEGFHDAARIMERIAAGGIGGRGPDGSGGGRDGGRGDSGRRKEQRQPVSLDRALIGGALATISGHPDYTAAKAGDIGAAVRLAQDIVTDDLLARLRDMIGESRPVIVPVISEEASGRNKIPRAAAEILAQRLGLDAVTGIVQSNAPQRTALSGLDRIFASPEFDGPADAGRDYLILDDTLTQGGTFAALASHIEAAGGRVIGAVALTGKQYSATLRPSDATLLALRDKHGDLENDFRIATGYGFDALTESEARYLAGFKPADAVRDRILAEGRRRGERENQGDDPAVRHQRDMSLLRDVMQSGRAKAAGLVSREFWRKSPGMFSDWLTDAMGKDRRFNILGAVPGHPLFAELGRNLPSAQAYLKNKQDMDAMRNDWQARAAAMVDRWTRIGKKDPKANEALMDLMHRTTLAGIDPSRKDDWTHTHAASAARILKDGRASPDRIAWARQIERETAAHKAAYADLRAAWKALPEAFRKLYREVRDEYGAMADRMDAALLANIATANRIALRRAERAHRKEMARIRDEGLDGMERMEAIDKADAGLASARKRAAAGQAARMAQMRQAFESNRLSGPYFPLSRFGTYFVTLRDADGRVVSFSRFAKKAQQEAFIREMEGRPGRVERGVLGEGADLRGMVDPRFVA
ncbi:Eco57I restriction-modification methylase domain-containing protein, partial [Paracoccus sp. (in: a-proteobacteria)]|uniref:LPD3 domain-containing protein n=1 Tax=Paracoccus sp. TaxID=267 RepID=UPI003A867CEA